MTSAISNDENTALMMALGIFYPLLLLSGIVWPIQGIPTALRWVVAVALAWLLYNSPSITGRDVFCRDRIISEMSVILVISIQFHCYKEG